MKVLIAGLGNMGMSHALAHHKMGADVVLVPVLVPLVLLASLVLVAAVPPVPEKASAMV